MSWAGYYQSSPRLHICATCGKHFAIPATAKRHVAKYHRNAEPPAILLLDNDEAVERLARGMAQHSIVIGFEHLTATCGPGCARLTIAALREGQK